MKNYYKQYQDTIARKNKKILQTINIQIGDTQDASLIDENFDEMIASICQDISFDNKRRFVSSGANDAAPCSSLAPEKVNLPNTIHPNNQKNLDISDEDIERINNYVMANDHRKIKYELTKNPQNTVGILFLILNDGIKKNLISSISEDIVDDYIQHAFKRLLETARRSNGWHGTGPIHAWLVRVAKNAFVEHQRSKETSFVDFGQDEKTLSAENKQDSEELFANANFMPLTMVHYSGAVTDVEDNISYRMAIEELKKCAENESYRVLQLLMDGYEIDEVAQILNMPLSRAKKIHEGLKTKMLEIMD